MDRQAVKTLWYALWVAIMALLIFSWHLSHPSRPEPCPCIDCPCQDVWELPDAPADLPTHGELWIDENGVLMIEPPAC